MQEQQPQKKGSSAAVIALIVIAALAGGLYFFKTSQEKKIRAMLDKTVKESQPLFNMSYDGVSFNPVTFKSSISGLAISSTDSTVKIAVREIALLSVDTRTENPEYLHAVLSDISFVTNDPSYSAFQNALDEMGYTDFKPSVEIDYAAYPQNHEFEMKKLRIWENRMGDLSTAFKLGNVPSAEEMANPLTVLLAMPALTVHSASLTYSDNGLAESLLKSEAKRKGKTLEEARKDNLDQLDSEIAAAKDDYEKDILVKFKEFIKAPKRISFTVNPPKPMAFLGAEPENGESTAKRMNIKASN